MADEIERKFFLNKKYKISHEISETRNIQQSYITETDTEVVRARLVKIEGVSTGYLTTKSKNTGLSRSEEEHEIPVSEAKSLIKSANNVINKTRSVRHIDGFVFEFDKFKDQLNGLNIVEIEFNSIDSAESFDLEKYPFLGTEVTYDKKFGNHYLAKNTLEIAKLLKLPTKSKTSKTP